MFDTISTNSRPEQTADFSRFIVPVALILRDTRRVELERPSPSAPAVQPRGTTTSAGGANDPALDYTTFAARYARYTL